MIYSDFKTKNLLAGKNCPLPTSGQKLPPSDQNRFFKFFLSNFDQKTAKMGPKTVDLGKGDLNQQFLGLKLVSGCVIAHIKLFGSAGKNCPLPTSGQKLPPSDQNRFFNIFFQILARKRPKWTQKRLV